MWGYENYMGGSWWMAGGLMLVSVVVIGLVVWLAISSSRNSRTAIVSATAPRQILDERYAKGDLTTEEYRERIQALTSTS